MLCLGTQQRASGRVGFVLPGLLYHSNPDLKQNRMASVTSDQSAANFTNSLSDACEDSLQGLGFELREGRSPHKPLVFWRSS